MSTRVLFRIDKDGGDAYALFPSLPGTMNPLTCTCYMHVGQHNAANLSACLWSSRPAKPEEYADLLEELRRVGYDDLVVAKRTTRNDYNGRLRAIQKSNP